MTARSNHWFYNSWDTDDGIWSVADGGPIPMMFVSFSSLKNPAHDPGPSNRHTGDMLVFTDWSSVAEYADGGAEERPDEWAARITSYNVCYTKLLRSRLAN